jgi:IS1 family transposase
MNRLGQADRVRIVGALVEGCSINSIVRMTGVSKVTILKLLGDMGRACLTWEDAQLRGLYCAQIEADEIWGFVHCKAKNVARAKAQVEGAGDSWTWYAVDRGSKAILSWIMGDRDESHAHAFMHDLASRLSGRPDLTTDGLGVYADAVFDAFARTGVDYAQGHKVYKNGPAIPGREDGAVCIGCAKKAVFGSPRLELAGTSRVERANLTLRMSQRRWTRKTNAHSKSFTNMQAAFALHACHYNWVRRHMTIGTTPAKALGLADREWALEDLVGLLEAQEAGERGED